LSKCNKCSDTGVIDTGNKKLACDCPAGDSAIFILGRRIISGAEVKRHYNHQAREKIDFDICVDKLPGRTEDLIQLLSLFDELPVPAGNKIKKYYRIISEINAVTSKMLGLKPRD